MEKAYDVKDLVARLKDKGLDLVEEQAVLVVEVAIDWLEESAAMSPSVVDDFAVKVLEHLKPKLLEAVDKIDGEDDEGR